MNKYLNAVIAPPMIQSQLARLLAVVFLLFYCIPSHADMVIVSPKDEVSFINNKIDEL